MFENVCRAAIKDIKEAFQKEVVAKIDDYTPIIMGAATFVIVVATCSTPARKVTQPIINVFIRR